MTRLDWIPGQLSFDDPVLAALAPPDPEPEPPPAITPESEPPSESLPLGGPALEVQVIRSSRRKKTAQARLVGSTVEVRIPARCSPEEEQQLVEHFTDKFERARSADAIDLDRRARKLARRFDLPEPTSIRWVGNQHLRWGSCTPDDGTIRLSDRLAEYPNWVIDYVIIHELAHLRVSAHNPEFWGLVDAYPLTERARGFLIAKGYEGE